MLHFAYFWTEFRGIPLATELRFSFEVTPVTNKRTTNARGKGQLRHATPPSRRGCTAVSLPVSLFLPASCVDACLTDGPGTVATRGSDSTGARTAAVCAGGADVDDAADARDHVARGNRGCVSAVGPLPLPRTSTMCVVVAARRHPLHKCAMVQSRGCGSRDVPRSYRQPEANSRRHLSVLRMGPCRGLGLGWSVSCAHGLCQS